MKLIKLITVVVLASNFAYSQLQVKNYYSFSGKKDISVNTITQDKDGFLLVGTNDGVFKFDGKSSTPLLKGNRILKKQITSLFIDKSETIWIGTKNGQVYTLKNHKLDSLILPAEETEKITSFCELKDAICMGTYGNGVYVYSNNKISKFNSDKGLSDNVVYKIISDFNDRVWCATDGGITEVKNINTKPISKIISDKTELPDNIVRDISYANEKLMISMQDSGVCYYNLAKSTIEKVPFYSNWSMGAVLYANTQASKNTIIGTERNGLLQIKNGLISIYKYDEYLQTNAINYVFVDRSKQIWVATKKGISQFYDRRFDFINSNKGLQDDKVLAIAVDNDNAIWMGTTNGISKLMINGEGKHIINKVQDATKYTLSCATKGPDGNIWFGTYGNGITIQSSHSSEKYLLSTANISLTNDNISNIYFSNENTVYISTLGGGLIKGHVDYENSKPTFKLVKTYTDEDGLGSNYVYTSITDKDGKLFVAADGGGLQMLQGEKFINLTDKYNIPSTTIVSLCRDSLNNIWASSNANGILKYDGKSIYTIGLAEGLRDEQPVQLVIANNTLFSINSKGIDKIDCKTNAISYYDLFEGDLEPNLNTVFFYKDRIFSGTNNGVLIFRTSKLPIDSVKPNAFIKQVQINYKPFPLDSVFELSHSQNNLTFTFDGIWLKSPDKITYRYRLQGLEDDWIFVNDNKVAFYNNLSAGTYTFIVQSKNEEDIWSEPAYYTFTILLPIWKKWWFWVVLLVVIGFGLYSFLKYRLKALQKENILLEEKVAIRTKEIEKQSEIIAAANKELEQLSIVASRTDNVVLILKPDGAIEYVNESFSKLNGISLTEILQQERNIFTSSNNPRIKEIVSEAIQSKKSIKYESYNSNDPNNEVWEASTLTPIFDDNDQLKKIIIIDSDITISKRQQKLIEQKNKDITDSISYARKIQHAILPDMSLIQKTIPNSFVFYLTKDIVSGDFYWFTFIDNCSIIAAIDCTGHGVPGAFMSLIGYNLLNKIVNEQKITDPSNILLELNNGVLEALYKGESESKDGMDVAICKINHVSGTVEYSGAMRPLWIIKEDELTEIKADKIPIGTKQQDRSEKIEYTTHVLKFEKGETFYIFTDGYADQFGGPKDKKYSTGKFKELLIENAHLPFKEQEKKLAEAHKSWKLENEQVDDILVIGFTI